MSLVVVAVLSGGPAWWTSVVVHRSVRAWWSSVLVQRVGTAWWYSVVVQRVGTLCQLINAIVGLGLGFVAYI